MRFGRKKIIHYVLLCMFMVSLVPVIPVTAASSSRSIEDALTLMYSSDAILLDEEDTEETAKIRGEMLPMPSIHAASPDEDLLVMQINATKAARNDLDANCRQLAGLYRESGDTCELDRIDNYCATKRAKLTEQLASLRQKRGDRRKAFTKLWHNVKRNSASFWRRIGPQGRNFLRKLGPEVLQMVQSGGFSGAAVKSLIKHHLKTFGRQQIRAAVQRGVQRLIHGQAEIAGAAGLEVCQEEEKQAAAENQTQAKPSAPKDELQLPTSGAWNLRCQHTWQTLIDEGWEVEWSLKINWSDRTFSGDIKGQMTEVDGNETLHWDWTADASGNVSDDGYLWGGAFEISTSTVTYGSNKPTITTHEYEDHWVGAIAEDLSKVCLTRTGAQDWLTTDWLREYGRANYISEAGTMCEALCIVGE